MPRPTAAGSAEEPWLRSTAAHLCDRPAVRRCLVIALVVGTLLTALNHGDALLRGTVDPSLIWKAPLTYLVPFAVSSVGYISGRRARARGEAAPADAPPPEAGA